MRSTLQHRSRVSLAILAVAGLALAGCSASPTPEASSSAPPLGPGDAGKADGVVTIYSAITDKNGELLEQSWADWAAKNGITINYESSKEFAAQIGIRAEGGNAPDIAIFPQPGLMASLAERSYIQPAPAGVVANVEKYWSKDWAGYATTNGTLYGAPLTSNVKGYIWYSPAQFKEWGVTPPKTWDDLLTLTKTIQQKTGKAPWCAGFSANASSGWPGSDWIEDLVLRQSGGETYDKWVNHEIPFTDPAIKAAFDAVGKILQDPKYVNAGYGDVASINSTTFGELAHAIGTGDCAMTHQASFFQSFLTDPANGNSTVGPNADVWAFMLPPVTAGSNAVTGGGEVVAAFSNDADTIKVQEYLSSPEWADSRVKLGGVISSNNGADPSLASSPLLQDAMKILADPKTTFRFDGSDLMPGVVASSFLTGMVDWINGKSTASVLSDVEGSWPSD